MARDGFNFNEKYCKECELRTNSSTNKGTNCMAGRKSNPLSLDATLNVIRNKGYVCSNNPAKKHFGAELHVMAAR